MTDSTRADTQGGKPQTTIEGTAIDMSPNPRRPPQAMRRPAGLGAIFMTHLAAAMVGGAVAIIATHYGLARFREQLPLLTDASALDLRRAQADLGARIEALRDAAAGNAALAGDIAGLRTELQTLQAAAAHAETPATVPSPAADAPEPAAERLAAAEERIAGLEAGLAALSQQSGERSAAARFTALHLTIQNLRRAVAGGGAFEAELRAVASLAPLPPSAAALSAAQSPGVATRAALAARLKADIAQARRAGVAATGGDLASRLLAAARSAVVVRQKGDAGDGVAGQLERATMLMAADDLAGALREVAAVTGPAAPALAAWRQAAEQRLLVDAALGALETHLLAEQAPATPGKGAS